MVSLMLIKNLKKKWRNLDKYTKLAIIVIFIGVLLRFILASISYVTGDACWHVNVIRFIANNFKIPLFEPLGRTEFNAPPLFHIIGAIFYNFFGLFGIRFAELSIKLLSPITGSLMLVYSFLLAKRLFNSKIGFYTVLFLTFLPNHIYHSAIPYIGTTMSLFVVMSIYYLLKNKIIFSAILIGLATLTKLQAPFVLLLLLFIIFEKYKKQKRVLIKKAGIFLIVFLLVSSVWYIRNTIYFGTPFGVELPTERMGLKEKGFNIDKAFMSKNYFKIYLGMFGVPSGHFRNLFFLDLPYINLLVGLWLVATIFFILPFLIGLFLLKKRKHKNMLLVWLLSFVLLLIVIITAPMDNIFARLLMPFFPIIAIIWAFGAERFFSIRREFLRKGFLVILILIIIGFLFTEAVKAITVKNTWSFYSEDFNWVKKNMPNNAIILVSHDDCFAYNFDRYTKQYYGYYIDTVEKAYKNNISYIWVNQQFKITSRTDNETSPLPNKLVEEIKDFEIIYYNTKTNTRIYKVP